MKRTLIALLAAGFAFAASTSFAQTAAEPAAPVHAAKAKSKSSKSTKSTKHQKGSHKVAHKKTPKAPTA